MTLNEVRQDTHRAGAEAPESLHAQRRVPFKLASALNLGPPTLRVRELGAALDFYKNDIRLQIKRRGAGPDGLELGELGFKQNAEPLLILKADPAAMAEVERLCGRVLMLKQGRIVDDGSPDALIARYGRSSLEEVFLDVARAPAGEEA